MSGKHGFLRRVIECECGRRFTTGEALDKHLRDELVNEMKSDMRRTLRRAAR